MLWVSDPKALQYIYQTSGYNFPKQLERRVLSQLVGDSGLTWADGWWRSPLYLFPSPQRSYMNLIAPQQAMCTSGSGR